MSGPPEPKLDEFDKNEWRDVSRRMRPDWTDEQFEEAWADFQKMKRQRKMQ